MPLVKEANLIARKLHLYKHLNPMLYAGKKPQKVNSQSIVYPSTMLNTLYSSAVDKAVVLCLYILAEQTKKNFLM